MYRNKRGRGVNESIPLISPNAVLPVQLFAHTESSPPGVNR